MALNPIPRNVSELLLMAEDAADGLTRLGVTLGVAQNTEAKVRADITALRTTQTAYEAERADQSKRVADQSLEDESAKAWLTKYRRRLSFFFPDSWTPQWGEAGFSDGSTAVPRTIGGRQELLASAGPFLTANTQYVDGTLDIDGTRAEYLYGMLSEARNLVNAGTATVEAKKQARDDALAALTKRMRGLLDELAQLLSPTDERWYVFGFNAPGDPATPEAAAPPQLSALGDGNLRAIFTLPRRADYAHLWVQQDGVDPEPRRLDGQFQSPALLSADDFNLPLNTPLQFTLAGVNPAGTGPQSTPIVVTIT
jgi:hypothetical protein